MEASGPGSLTSMADQESSTGPGQWAGQWRNQYGSVLTITDDRGQQIHGTFRTALGDSGFAGQDAEVTGLHVGDCLSFTFTRSTPSGDTIASFTGLLREGRLETLWHVITDSAVKSPQPGEPPRLMKLPLAHAALTSADTFERVR
jgi:Avidin family